MPDVRQEMQRGQGWEAWQIQYTEPSNAAKRGLTAESSENNVGNRVDTDTGRWQHLPLAVWSGALRGSPRFFHNDEEI